MWINASERKPDNSRKVFVRGVTEKGQQSLYIAKWLDFDNRWSLVIGILPEDYGGISSIDFWCEIHDLLDLPIENANNSNAKIDVPVNEIRTK
jgi:hypothetical protein